MVAWWAPKARFMHPVADCFPLSIGLEVARMCLLHPASLGASLVIGQLRLMISSKMETPRWSPDGEAHKACALAACVKGDGVMVMLCYASWILHGYLDTW